MDRESILLAGTMAGLLAAVLTITERLLNLRDRLRAADERDESVPGDPAGPVLPARVVPRSWRMANVSSYLLLHELGIILTAGVLLNYLGLLLSLRLQSILYLDMIGTALAAFLLGPWWAALVALLSSSLVNWLLFPAPGADLLIFPWVLVNMTGGLFWGYMARRTVFRRYVKTAHASAVSHAVYLLSFGALGACLMAVPGTFVQAALSEPGSLALSPEVAKALEAVVRDWQDVVQGGLAGVVGAHWGTSAGWAALTYVQNCLRYIPDKTLSVAIALMILKSGFPLFERELIHGGPSKARVRDTAAAPLILGALYLPAFWGLLLTDGYRGHQYWPVWAAPWAVIIGGIVLLRRWGPSDESVRQACLARASRYVQAFKPLQREPAHDFGQRLMIATLVSSLIFVLSLPLAISDFYQSAFNFFCLVYGVLLGVYLIRVAISQNVSVSRAGK